MANDHETLDAAIEDGEVMDDSSRQVDTSGRVIRGRGGDAMDLDNRGRYQGKSGRFDAIEDDSEQAASSGFAPAKSVEGWVVFVTGIHEEATEDDIHDKFADCGAVRNVHLNLDRRSGFVKGYAVIEFEKKADADKAVSELDGQEIMGKQVGVSYAFRRAPNSGNNGYQRRSSGGYRRRSGGGGDARRRRY